MAKAFKPFEHDNIELKNELINYARSIKDNEEVGSQLACAMIYSSFAEYMANNLLENLRHLAYRTTYRDYAGILFVDLRSKGKEKPRTMGATLGLLKQFGFPDKEDIIELIQSVSKSRNNLFHNFASVDLKGHELLSDDIENIKEKTEELFLKINSVYIGLKKIVINDDISETEENENGNAPEKPSKKEDDVKS